ncbi:hypothetical protein HRTV-25_gp36 [Halorubrum tailed virus 25]|uniref:Uncharacterized protein n=1 Tax=Halorubrum tailed virus 25 TaxID=2878006 RepID=A0AAE8XYJ4_9CAUD|nr:hypothetical protein M1M37_gp036 [Halorubrum tailed virus 25]UBF22617.1 hypothetical protein HRTV-25_gp36 [Halorubrum tailed virus 25]
MIPSIQPEAVLASAISTVCVIVLYHYLGREYLGAEENKYWNALRRTVLAGLDPYVQKNTQFALTNRAHPEEFVTTVDMSPQAVAETFEAAGFVQGVISGLKDRGPKDEPDYEVGSMVFREARSDLVPDCLALYQVHVFWFENADGTCDVYAHHEYSSLNPLVAWQHYRAVGQDPVRGKKAALKVVE